MQIENLKKLKIPDMPGVYFFKKGKTILYIGKATSLRDRIKSYFGKDLVATRGPAILDMVVQSNGIKWQKKDSVLEALIAEANLIKKYQPKYNIKEKDDKSWNYVCITKEKYPKIILKRGKELKKEVESKSSNIFGPYTNGGQLKEAMRIVRRFFPFMDDQSSKKNNLTFYRQIRLVPESSEEYRGNIKNLKLFFAGKKSKIIRNFKKEMMNYAKNMKFEKAEEIKRKIFALEHIQDISLVKEDVFKNENRSSKIFRVESYDIAHLSGGNMVGVMAVAENGSMQRKEYRKFIIRTQKKANDTGALEEILSRRFAHSEWGIPNLIVVDGGVAQINVAKRILLKYRLKIPVTGVVKDEHHKAKAIMGHENLIKDHKKIILLANTEAHRFAISFFRNKKRKSLFG